MRSENLLVNTVTRRTFMKTSALTVGSVALLSGGFALGNDYDDDHESARCPGTCNGFTADNTETYWKSPDDAPEDKKPGEIYQQGKCDCSKHDPVTSWALAIGTDFFGVKMPEGIFHPRPVNAGDTHPIHDPN